MGTIYINAQWPEELRIATVKNGKLFDLEIELQKANRNKGNIYNAKIVKIESSLNAVFLDYGGVRNGFLPLKEIHKGYLSQNQDGKHNLSDLKIGQKMLVQVEKDERGEKGAALTTYISLAGTFLVFMPFSGKSAVTKQAENKERSELKAIIEGLNLDEGTGIIVRTAGIGKTNEELSWDYNALKHHWSIIENASNQNEAPCMIFQESDTLIRVLRDNLRQDTDKIIIDTQKGFDLVKSFLSQTRPGSEEIVELNDQTLPLFTQFDLEDKIKSIYDREIRLPSGGAIIIDTTEALTAIDVNSSRSTKSTDIETTAKHTNLEAIEVIANQLRIRDIGGIVVIDFIDMNEKSHRTEVEDRAKQLFSLDRAKIKTESISNLTGCMSLLRQRLRSFANNIMTFKSECNIDSFAMYLLRNTQSLASEAQVKNVQLQVSVNIATYILNECREIINRISANVDCQIHVIPNPNYAVNEYSLKAIRGLAESAPPSYTQKDQISPESNYDLNANNNRTHQTPAITENLYNQPLPKGNPLALFIRFFFNLFKNEQSSPKKSHSKKTDKPENSSSSTRKPYGKRHSKGNQYRRKRNTPYNNRKKTVSRADSDK